VQPTDDEIRGKLVRNGHDNFLECVYVVGIAKPSGWPRDVDCPAARSAEAIVDQKTYFPSPDPEPTISNAPKSLVG